MQEPDGQTEREKDRERRSKEQKAHGEQGGRDRVKWQEPLTRRGRRSRRALKAIAMTPGQ
jgi:hypothetical protein